MKQKLSILSLLLLFTTAGFAQVTATQPPDIMQCGWEVFNLTQQDDIILGGQDPEYYFVTYFETQADAEANTNVIMDAEQYVSNGQNQTIYARVSSTMDDGFAVTSFEISWSSWQEIPINEPTPLEACYEEGAEFVVVDFTSKSDEILAGTTGFELTYYLTGNDVEMGTNPISNPEAFEWPVDFEYDYIYVRVTNPVTGCFNITTIEVAIVECTDSTISGTLTFDDGENGCADGSPGAYIMLSLTHDNDVYYTYTDANGNYIFYNVPDGINIINVMGQGVQTYQTLPASYTLTTPAVLEGNDFCLTAPEPYNDVAVYIIPYQAPRPGFPFQCAILIQNLGNTTLNGTVTLQFDDTIVTYNSSSPSMALSGNTLTIPYTNLDPFIPQYIYVDFTVFTPPTVNEGDILELTANVTAVVEGDDDTSNNQQELALTVVNSWDPNDIACREGEFITEEQADGYLHYLIRFQNTGNADAINIRIEDVLDSKFDAASFQPIAASHNYRIEMEGSTVQFIFEGINLPGEEVNEPESHGFISYRIKPNTNVQLGDTFEATAGIYFDFNEPVITNTATTTIQNNMSVGAFAKGSFAVYPNPAKDIIRIQTQEELSSYEILNILGQVLLKGNFQSGENNISLESLSKGTYILNLNIADGSSQSSKIIKE